MKIKFRAAIFFGLVLFATSYSNRVVGQTDTILTKIFYNLPLDSSRAIICNKLKNDKRFSEIRDISDTGKYHISLLGALYYGKVLTKGIIKTMPDSIRIQVSCGTRYFGRISCPKPSDTEKISSKDISFIQLDYYYLDANSMEEAYIYLMSSLYSTGKKVECGANASTDKGAKGEGCYVYFDTVYGEPNFMITKWSLPNYGYSLEIIFTRKGM